jgi:hypothetical protein
MSFLEVRRPTRAIRQSEHGHRLAFGQLCARSVRCFAIGVKRKQEDVSGGAELAASPPAQTDTMPMKGHMD